MAVKLAEAKKRDLTLRELQDAFIELAELHNATVAHLNRMIDEGRIRSKQEAIENQRYGL